MLTPGASYPLPTSSAADRQLDAEELRPELLADAAELVASALPDGPERAALLTLVHSRAEVFRLLRRREAARLIARDLALGMTREQARDRAARAVGVHPSTLRQRWGL